jgi:hypothetical protein
LTNVALEILPSMSRSVYASASHKSITALDQPLPGEERYVLKVQCNKTLSCDLTVTSHHVSILRSNSCPSSSRVLFVYGYFVRSQSVTFPRMPALSMQTAHRLSEGRWT